MNKYFFFIPAALILAAGCKEFKHASVGGARDVLIFTNHKDLVENEIALALEKPVYTPEPGPEFAVDYMERSQLEGHLYYHSLFFVGLESDPIIKENFPNFSANDSFALYRIEDPWAKGQTVLLFLARDTTTLLFGLGSMKEKIYETFKYKLLERLSAMTYEKGDDSKLSQQAEKYGFKIKVPREWYFHDNYAKDGFIWINTHDPDRVIFVYREPREREDLSVHSMLALRDSLTKRFYEGDYMDTTFLTAGPSYFRGLKATKIEGLWQNDSLIIGGPMVGFAYNEGGKFWMVDAMLFYPTSAAKKLFWLNQLEVILATFEPLK